ncbi:MAG: endonuclease III domain-containing protein [Elainellaceae cyanobacterium]
MAEASTNQSAATPFTVERALDRIAPTMAAYPKAAMFALADEGYKSLFEQLISCIISIRTYDEVSLPASRRLFSQARTPVSMAALSVDEIATLIEPSTYGERKAEQISAIAWQIVDHHGGELPADVELLRSFSGVGPKCAHLALGVGSGQPYISVDTHVHRVVNRWGLVRTRTPEKTLAALEGLVSRSRWVDINRILMPFGKYVCRTAAPQCSSCPVEAGCQQVDVFNPQ